MISAITRTMDTRSNIGAFTFLSKIERRIAMVMMAYTGFEGGFQKNVDHEGPLNFDAEFQCLESEILKSAEDAISSGAHGSELEKAVAAEVAIVLRAFAQEVSSPCVIYVRKDTNAWEERVRHIRDMAGMTYELTLQAVAQQIDLALDDPRIENLKPVAADIAERVSQAVEAAIETAKPEGPSVDNDPAPAAAPRM